jgi:hypothetical protein
VAGLGTAPGGNRGSMKSSTVSFLQSRKYLISLSVRSAAIYRSDDDQIGVVFTMSKWHAKNENYWYAYHPHQDEFLATAKHGYFILGMMDLDLAVALPVEVMRQNLSKL